MAVNDTVAHVHTMQRTVRASGGCMRCGIVGEKSRHGYTYQRRTQIGKRWPLKKQNGWSYAHHEWKSRNMDYMMVQQIIDAKVGKK